MWELSTNDWKFALGPNLWGVIHGVRVFGKHLVEQDEGHFVNTASMAGLVSVPRLGPYNVTKHSVVTLSETLAGDLAEVGSQVGVSVLCPGFVNTRIFESERNRPADLLDGAPMHEAEDYTETKAAMQAFLETAMPPSEVAERVYEAVRDRTFYILTHENTKDAVRARLERIIDAKQPAAPEGGATVFAR